MTDAACTCGHPLLAHRDAHGKPRTCASCACPGFRRHRLYSLADVEAAWRRAHVEPPDSQEESKWRDFIGALLEGRHHGD